MVPNSCRLTCNCVIQRAVNLLLMNLLLVNWAIKAAQIVQHPQDKVMLVSSADERVSFTCKVELAHYGVTWKVNDSVQLPPGALAEVTYSGNVSISVLTFPSQSSYNSTTIQCTGRGFGGEVESNRVVLAYQGLLDKPNKLRVINGLRDITVLWTAPFSLDVTGVEPDIWYSVIVHNITDEHRAPVSYPECDNITETYCNFTPANPSPCHKYQFSVIPKNGVGDGIASVDIVGYIHRVPPGISLLGANVTVTKTSEKYKYRVVITTPISDKLLCFGELPEYYELHYESTDKQCPETESIVFSNVSTHYLQSDVQLGDRCNYTVRVVTQNEAGGINSTETLSISTTVILVEVQLLMTALAIRCVFQYTLSHMCYIQLVSDIMGGYHEGVYLEGETEASHNFTGLLPGVFTVLVYGVRAGSDASCQELTVPDFITVARINASQPTTHTLNTSVTHEMATSSFLCVEGMGLGVGVGGSAAAVVFLAAIIIARIAMKRHRKNTLSMPHEKKLPLTMEKNVAYEMHRPLACPHRL